MVKKSLNSKIIIDFDYEKLRALKKYSSEKNINVEEELVNTINRLYERVVPPSVKIYIEDVLTVVENNTEIGHVEGKNKL